MIELKDLKVGDELMCRVRLGYQIRFAHVIRLTKTQAELHGGVKVSLNSGKQIGTSGRYSTIYWILATQKAHAEHDMKNKIHEARAKLERVKVTEKNVDAILSMLGELEEKVS